MSVHHYTLDEEGVGDERGPSVFSSLEMLNDVLKAIPKGGDIVHLTVVMGPLMKSRGARLYQRENVTFDLVMKNRAGLPITADVKRESLS